MAILARADRPCPKEAILAQAILAQADRPCPKEGCDQTAWEAFQVRIDPACHVVPACSGLIGCRHPAGRSRLSGSRGEIRPQRILGNWGHYVPGQAEAPANPAAGTPAAASGTGESTWGGDDRRGRRDRGGPGGPQPVPGFSGRTSFGKWWSRRKTRRGTRS